MGGGGAGLVSCGAIARASTRSRAPRRAGPSLAVGAGAGSELLVRERSERVDRQPAKAGLVEVDVAARKIELLEVAHGRPRAGCPARGGRPSEAAPSRFESLRPSSPTSSP